MYMFVILSPLGKHREGGVYSLIRVLPDVFLLKAIVFTVTLCEHEYTPPPSPPNYHI